MATSEPLPIAVPSGKRVSLVELFYDLVYVYMISRATALLRHTKNGTIDPLAVAVFVLVIVVFVNSWMVQMVFTNRYGRGSWTDMFFSFADMAIVLYMSNAFGAGFDRHLTTFFIAAGLLSLTLCLQYLLAHHRSATAADKQITTIFAAILGFRTLALIVGAVVGGTVGLVIALLGILVSWIAPGFTGAYTRQHPIIFSHLLERLTALTIIMFGEMIVGLAGYFTATAFDAGSVLVFLTVAALFYTYIVEFDHLIDEHRTGETGNLLIYLHYLVLFGLSLMTAAIELQHEVENGLLRPAAVMFFIGLALFYCGLALANHYNKPRFVVTPVVVVIFAVSTVAGGVVCCVWPVRMVLIAAETIVTLINAVTIGAFLMNRGRVTLTDEGTFAIAQKEDAQKDVARNQE